MTIIHRPVIYYNDVEQLIERIAKKMKCHPYDLNYNVGMDAAKGSLKLTLNMFEPDVDLPAAKIMKYGDEHTVKYKNTGEKKSILLAVSADTPETYENTKAIFEMTNVNILPFKLASDHKMQNILLGLQTHSSTHPCPFCNKSIAAFSQPVPPTDVKKRTLEDICMLHQS